MTSMRGSRRRTRLLSCCAASTPAVALAWLLPKCPLCLAAPLALLGVTFSDARALVLGTRVALAAAVLLLVARHVRR